MDTGTKLLIVSVFIGVSILLPQQVDAAQPPLDSAPTLLDLAKAKFGELTEAEQALFIVSAMGKCANLRVPTEKDNDPANAANWPKARSIRAECIEWLCMKSQVEYVTHKGIVVQGVRIEGELNLVNVKIPFPLDFGLCAFPEGMNLRRSEIYSLYLEGTHTGPIQADGITIHGELYLRNGFRSKGIVSLIGATVGGQFSCSGASFINPNGHALAADKIKVTQSLMLRDGFRAEGEVRLLSATIGGTLDCSNSQFINKGKISLHGDGLTVKGPVFLNKGFKAQGEVNLLGTKIGGDLICTGGKFEGASTVLSADKAEIKGNVFMDAGFMASGEVRFPAAIVGGQFICTGGKFINPNGYAIVADGIKVDQGVYLLNGFSAIGGIRLVRATILGNLDCDGGQFVNPRGRALNADGINVTGNVFLRNEFKAFGRVDFVNSTITGYFIWTGIDSLEGVSLDLRSAKVGTLWDDPASWPQPGKLFLDGFDYERLDEDAPQDADARKRWLRLQPKDRFLPQPYEQLASVLRKMGKDADAKKILIAKNEDRARQPNLTPLENFWLRQIGPIIGYGYRSWAVCWLMVLFILSGWLLFGVGHWDEQFVPLTEKCPEFSGFAYSCDTFFPILNLYQARYYTPSPNCGPEIMPGTVIELRTGKVLRFYLWFHIGAGWILTTLLVVGLTGLVRT